MEKQPSLFPQDEIDRVRKQDEVIREKYGRALQSRVPAEIDYWESWMEKVDRHRLGNLAYRKRTTGRELT